MTNVSELFIFKDSAKTTIYEVENLNNFAQKQVEEKENVENAENGENLETKEPIILNDDEIKYLSSEANVLDEEIDINQVKSLFDERVSQVGKKNLILR